MTCNLLRVSRFVLLLTTSSLALAAGETPRFFVEIASLLVVSAVVAYLSYRLGLVPIIGFLAAGVLLGPSALGLVQDPELIDAAAEVGVILLLFTIGLEFSLERLARIRRIILLGGGAQVGLTVGAVTLLLLLFGVDWRAALFTGCLISLSSTAIVLKLLSDRGETNTEPGQIALGLLIFQDLAVVLMVLVVPMLGGEGETMGSLGLTLLTAAGVVAGVLLLARRVMPLLLEAVARTCSQEIFLLTLIAVCFGTAYLTSLVGVSLSLGAFLAGLLVSESRYDQQAMGEVLPLQILFSAAFFVSVGLLLDLAFLVQNLPLVLGAILGVLVLKALLVGASVRILGYGMGTTAASALLLAQVGEFSFVLERAGREVGLSPAGLGDAGAQTFIAATVLLMGATPFLAQLGGRLERSLGREVVRNEPPSAGEVAPLYDHVIIAGYGEGGKKLAQAFTQEGTPCLILTLSPGGALEAEEEGYRVVQGDYARTHLLERAGLASARLLVIPDDEPEMAKRVTSVAKLLNPKMQVLVRTRSEVAARELRRAGADAVSEERTSVAGLLSRALGMAEGQETGRLERYLGGLFDEPEEPRTFVLSGAELDSKRCVHQGQTHAVNPYTAGCEECLRMGDTWVHLRICLSCGHVGCCDSSKNKHATKHFQATEHPIVKSFEPGETWSYCYLDKATL